MKKILVPVDFSPHTETVCRHAMGIAKRTGGELRLFHAYFDFMIATNTTFPYTIETNEVFNQEMMVKIRDDAKAEMQKLHTEMVEEIRREGIKNVKIVFTLTGGLPEEEILNISETYAPDLIVMGTRGKGEKDILTGKVSTKVVQNATCRLLTVPREAEYRGYKNILYATDFADEDKSHLEKLIDLLSGYQPVIHCIHVDTDSKSKEIKDKMNLLRVYFTKKRMEDNLIFNVIEGEDFIQCLDDYINDKAIDLIAVVRHRKSFLKRLFTIDHTRKLLYHSGLPLYIFPGE